MCARATAGDCAIFVVGGTGAAIAAVGEKQPICRGSVLGPLEKRLVRLVEAKTKSRHDDKTSTTFFKDADGAVRRRREVGETVHPLPTASSGRGGSEAAPSETRLSKRRLVSSWTAASWGGKGGVRCLVGGPGAGWREAGDGEPEEAGPRSGNQNPGHERVRRPESEQGCGGGDSRGEGGGGGGFGKQIVGFWWLWLWLQPMSTCPSARSHPPICCAVASHRTHRRWGAATAARTLRRRTK